MKLLWKWPTDPPHADGFNNGISKPADLVPGDILERITFRDERGKATDGMYAVPPGTSFDWRSLPPDRLGKDATVVPYTLWSRPLEFHEHYVSIEHHFSLGYELDEGIHYLSIPVSNGIVDYEEYYRLEESEFRKFLSEPSQAIALVVRCRLRQDDERLIQEPGWNRGTPV